MGIHPVCTIHKIKPTLEVILAQSCRLQSSQAKLPLPKSSEKQQGNPWEEQRGQKLEVRMGLRHIPPGFALRLPQAALVPEILAMRVAPVVVNHDRTLVMLIAAPMTVGRNEKDVLRTEKPLELAAEIALLILAPKEAGETARRTGMVIGIRIVAVIGTAKGTEKRTGTGTGIAREIENARERGTETETGTVVTTRIATGKREKNAKLLPYVASRLLRFPLSLLMTVASLSALTSRDTAIHPRTEMIVLEKGDDRQTMMCVQR